MLTSFSFPPSLVGRGTFSSLSRETTRSPTSLTLNQMESQAQLPQQHPNLRSQTPNLQNLFPSGLTSPHATFLPNNICMESTTTEGAPVAEGLPEMTNAIGTQEKTTETEANSPLATVYACPVPGGRFQVKFGFQPIKLDLLLLVHAYTANCVRVHFRHLGVYKGSRVA